MDRGVKKMRYRKWTITVVILVLFMSNTLCFESDDDGDGGVADTNGGDTIDPNNNGTTGPPDPNGTIPDQNQTFPNHDVRWYSVLDPVTSEEMYRSAWAIYNVSHGGNMNEHYLATTREGWITNLGGEIPFWTTDNGLTWDSYQPPTVMSQSGEGSITYTPDGDIVSMTWDPWTGDRFIAYHYDSASGDWTSFDNRMHMAFYDRPWQVTVPGPIDIPGGPFPWATIVMSNYWDDMVISVDGLVYSQLNEPSAASNVEWDLDFTDVGREFDFMTPHRKMLATPLPGGGMLIPRAFGDSDAILTNDLTWEARAPIEGQPIPAEHLVIDSSGALHSVDVQGSVLIYYLSLDGGRTWNSEQFSWEDKQIEDWDFQADGHHGLAVINIIAGAGGEPNEHLIYHIRDYRDSQKADSLTYVGLGDVDTIAAVSGGDDRFDFASLAIQPDGSVVLAFCDSTHIDPMIAIELQAPYD